MLLTVRVVVAIFSTIRHLPYAYHLLFRASVTRNQFKTITKRIPSFSTIVQRGRRSFISYSERKAMQPRGNSLFCLHIFQIHSPLSSVCRFVALHVTQIEFLFCKWSRIYNTGSKRYTFCCGVCILRRIDGTERSDINGKRSVFPFAALEL